MEVLVTFESPAEIQAWKEFLQRHQVRHTVLFDVSLTSKHTSLNSRQKATKSFKHFCGSEWIHKNGFLTVEEAVQRILLHVRTHNLRGLHGVINVDDELHEALGLNQTSFYEHEIHQVAQKAFESLGT